MGWSVVRQCPCTAIKRFPSTRLFPSGFSHAVPLGGGHLGRKGRWVDHVLLGDLRPINSVLHISVPFADCASKKKSSKIELTHFFFAQTRKSLSPSLQALPDLPPFSRTFAKQINNNFTRWFFIYCFFMVETTISLITRETTCVNVPILKRDN